MRRLWMVTLIGVGACVIGPANPASAHGDVGTIEVVSITSAAPLSLRVEANITFVGDGHAAPAATATVVAERAGATTVGPITLTAAGTTGRYSAMVALPSAGEWTLRLTSLSPTAVLERRETVIPSPTTSVAGGPGPLTSTVAPTTLVDPATTVPSEPGKDRVATTLVFIGVLVAIAIVAALAIRSSRLARGKSGSA